MANDVTITSGRLTGDPELRKTSDGVSVTDIRLAVDKARKNSDGTRDSVFMDFTIWRQNAEFVCSHFKKGDYITIQGHHDQKTRKLKDGTEVRVLYLVADQVSFCGYRRPQE